MPRLHGLFAGWDEYRNGTAKKPTLAGKKAPVARKLVSGQKREHIINQLLDKAREWKSSPFEIEGPARAALRSALCLSGYRWALSDIEADSLVAECLRLIGAKRPTWAEGQPQFTDSTDACSWCRRPLPEDRSSAQRFCSDVCAQNAINQRDYEAGAYRDSLGRLAYRTLAGLKNAPLKCEHCGRTFYSDRAGARFCSTRCSSRQSKGDLLYEECACAWCGETFMPSNRGQRCCSLSCRSYARQRELREMLAETMRTCGCCGTSFTPKTEKQKYCCEKCTHTMANRAYLQRKVRSLHECSCEWCGERFLAKMPWAKYCSQEHRALIVGLDRQSARLRDGNRLAVAALSPAAFDGWFLRAA